MLEQSLRCSLAQVAFKTLHCILVSFVFLLSACFAQLLGSPMFCYSKTDADYGSHGLLQLNESSFGH